MVSISENDKEQYIKFIYEKEGSPLDKFLDSGFIDIEDIYGKWIRNVTLPIILRCPEGQIPKNIISSRRDIELRHLRDTKRKTWDWSTLTSNTAITFREISSTYTSLPWDWKVASSRPDLDFDFVIDHPDLKWSWDILSGNPNIKLEHYKKYPKLPWDFLCMCSNRNFPVSECLKFPSGSYKMLSRNTNLSLDFARSNPEKNWDFRFLSERKDFQLSDIQKFTRHKNEMNWVVLSQNIQIKDILENRDFPWDITQVSNRELNIQIILDNLSFPWNWFNLSVNLSVPASDIILNVNLPWNWKEGVSSRKDILTPEFMGKFLVYNPDLPWDWDYISCFGDPDTILDNKDLPWDWRQFSVNPNLGIRHAIDPKNINTAYVYNWWFVISRVTPMEIIKKYPHHPWDAIGLLINPEITPDFIKEHEDLWWVNTWRVCHNPFLYDDLLFSRRFREDVGARKNQVRKILNESSVVYDDIIGKILDYVGYR